MKIDILTLFPEMFDSFTSESIIKRAIDDKKVKVKAHNFRDYAKNKHKKVDDTPYGGGNGMVLMCQPIFDAVEALKKKNTKVILMSPQGKKYDQKKAYELSKEKHLLIICGHYEGFDERIRTIADEEISIGDYVLTGGEIPAMAVCDSVIRLIPGVIEEGSHVNDSFNNNLLDYPTYTKPRDYKGMKVPDVLLSGDHAMIEKWRHEKQIEVTKKKRPDLLKKKVVLTKNEIGGSKNSINVDDIKDIKVTEIKEEKKPKKEILQGTIYCVIKEEKPKAITILKSNLVKGYTLKGKDNNGEINKIVIVKPTLIKKIAMKNINKKINVLTYRMNVALAEDDDDSTNRVLGEAEMLKSMIISAYSTYLGKEDIDKIIKNINVLVSTFMKNRTFQKSLVNDSYGSNRHR